MKTSSVYVDSNVFLYPVIYDELFVPKAKNSKNFLLKIARKEIEAYTSVLTWDEIVWVIKKKYGAEIAVEEGRNFLRFPNLRMLEISSGVIIKAQEIMEKYKLRPRDAIHAATAIESQIHVIVSYDKHYDLIDSLKRIEP